ncbi:unnamed protein product [Dovyalis caffra]|uniref:Uncharacterized protein n=1 Tax=Dovyalis caffra TaxID=77055 RepID=A0AAV1RFF6_9ROSI|nr:unnamed protein product [Dovyalis caffra]
MLPKAYRCLAFGFLPFKLLKPILVLDGGLLPMKIEQREQACKVLRQKNVSCVVAPYEANAQMTFLAISKQIIFKMDKYGQGVEFQSSRLQQNKDMSFAVSECLLRYAFSVVVIVYNCCQEWD